MTQRAYGDLKYLIMYMCEIVHECVLF